MAITLKQAIKKREKKLSQQAKKLKALALEVNGMFRDNIGKQRITPKTKGKENKTLFDKGLGQKGYRTLIDGDKLRTGNFYPYMQYHLDGTKHLDVRNWLMKPPKLDKVMELWIRDFIKI